MPRIDQNMTCNRSGTNRIRIGYESDTSATPVSTCPSPSTDHGALAVWGSGLAEMPDWELYVTLLDSVKECYEAFVSGGGVG